jgi:hypothetical protein
VSIITALRDRLRRSLHPAARTMDSDLGRTSPAPTSFSPDRPIQLLTEDQFNRSPFAQRIVQAIVNRTDPSNLIVGIYGKYGEGKTSVLNLIRGELAKHERFVVVAFNPWLFGEESQLLAASFYTLADALGRNLNRSREVGEILRKYSFALAAFKPFGLDFSDAAQKLGQELSSEQLETQRQKLEEILRHSGKRVVVIIDDIDRLDRGEVQAIFKLVKVAADFEYVTYVLAFDERMVADALSERFPGGGSKAGHAFLEKIIQVPLYLPPVEKLVLRRALFQAVDAALSTNEVVLGEDESQRFVKIFTEGLENRLTTPRMVSRYANAIAFAIPQLREEANMTDCLLIEGIRLLYPDLYSCIRNSPEPFLGPESSLLIEEWEKSAKQVIDGCLTELSEEERSAATSLIQGLFPRTKSILGNVKYGSGKPLDDLEERLAREQRIASRDYFSRFFQYAVAIGDLSDRSVQKFVGSLASLPTPEVETELRQLAANQREERLVAKLREREKSIGAPDAERLAEALAVLGGIFPNTEGFYPFSGPFSQAAILIYNLVKRVPSGDQREQLIQRIIARAAPVSFAVEIMRWFQKSPDQDESERIVSARLEGSLMKEVANRIADESRLSPPYLTDTKTAPRLFNVWFAHGDKESLKAYLIQRFGHDPTEAAKFLATYLPTVWSGSSGLSSKGPISRETYNGIANIIDPERMVEYLKQGYGSEIGGENSIEENRKDADALAAASFCRMYLADQNESRSEKAAPSDLTPRS